MTTHTLDFNAVRGLGELLEQAQERLNDNRHMMEEEAVEFEQGVLDSLWKHYDSLMDLLKNDPNSNYLRAKTMNIYEKVHGQSSRDKLRELVDMHGMELYIARALILRVSDDVCDELLYDMEHGMII